MKMSSHPSINIFSQCTITVFINTSCLPYKSFYPRAFSCVLWLILMFAENIRNISYIVSYLTVVCEYYISDCKIQTEPVNLGWSTCTRDFIQISSWWSSQTDGRGSAEFIISVSLSTLYRCLPSMCTRAMSKFDALVDKITLFYVWHHSLQPDIDSFSTGPVSDHNWVTHSHLLPLLKSMQCFDVCVSVQVLSQMGCEFHRAQGQFGEWLSQQCARASQHTLQIHQ